MADKRDPKPRQGESLAQLYVELGRIVEAVVPHGLPDTVRLLRAAQARLAGEAWEADVPVGERLALLAVREPNLP
ncbi:MAG: hypothetical protein K2X11_14935 [Acetobacteraceae bacterium]|nr:hypothetical protein [Acetobacteraceae bacterium]